MANLTQLISESLTVKDAFFNLSPMYMLESTYVLDFPTLPKIDGFAGANSATSSASANLTTTNAADIIYVIAEFSTSGASSPTMTGGGLTWVTRAGPTSSAASGISGIIFYATTTAILSASSLTFSVTGTNINVSFIVFGISGINLSSPFDTNAGLPFSNTATATSKPTVSGISTDGGNVMLLSIVAEAGTGQGVKNNPSGFITIGNNPGGTRTAAAYWVVSGPQSSTVQTWGASVAGGWVIFADALVYAAPEYNFDVRFLAPGESLTLSDAYNIDSSPSTMAEALTLVDAFPEFDVSFILPNETVTIADALVEFDVSLFPMNEAVTLTDALVEFDVGLLFANETLSITDSLVEVLTSGATIYSIGAQKEVLLNGSISLTYSIGEQEETLLNP